MMVDGARVWGEVQANQAMLKGCKRPHDFAPVAGTFRIGGRQICSKCGGTLGNVEAMYYKEGLADADKANREGR